MNVGTRKSNSRWGGVGRGGGGEEGGWWGWGWGVLSNTTIFWKQKNCIENVNDMEKSINGCPVSIDTAHGTTFDLLSLCSILSSRILYGQNNSGELSPNQGALFHSSIKIYIQ